MTTTVLTTNRIVLNGTARTREEAIAESARLLVAAGAVTPDYEAAMRERESLVSTFMGNGLAIPHGTNEAKEAILASALAGAALVVLADLLARTVLRPAELPLGAVTALIGVPFFLWRLRRMR